MYMPWKLQRRGEADYQKWECLLRALADTMTACPELLDLSRGALEDTPGVTGSVEENRRETEQHSRSDDKLDERKGSAARVSGEAFHCTRASSAE